VCTFIFGTCLYAQITDNSFAKTTTVRRKATIGFIVEDSYWRNANIGFEHRFTLRHAVGIDYVYFRGRYENDSIVNGVYYGSGFNAFWRRDYLILDYRFYMLSEKNVDQKSFHPY
jgi:hypothetical protein